MTRQSSISLAERVLGVDNPADGLASLSRAYHSITGEYANPADLIAESEVLEHTIANRGNPDNYAIGPDVIERSVILNSLRQLFVDRDLNYTTLLKYWPVYEDLYTRHAQPLEDTGPRKALLVGTLSALSSAAFTAFSQDVLQAEPVIIDPYPSPIKRRHGTFVEANALDLPRDWSDSIRVVMTSSLITMLLDTDNQPVTGQQHEQEMRHTLYKQIFQVLEPGGSLLMSEVPPRYNIKDHQCKTAPNQRLVAAFADELHADLDSTGFSDIVIDEGWEFAGVDYLFDPSRQFDQYERIPTPRFRTVYARKPEVKS